MKRKEPVVWSPIEIVVSSTVVKGSYSIDGTGWMTVQLKGGGSTSAPGGPGASDVARIILGELYEKSQSRPRRRGPDHHHE